MKTATINIYHMPELEQEIKSGVEKEEQVIRIISEQYALNNGPPLSNEDIGPYWLEFDHFYRGLQNEVVKRIPPDSLRIEMEEHQQATDREVQLLNNKVSRLKLEGRSKEDAVNSRKKPVVNKLKVKALWIATVAILLVDAIITAPTFQGSGFNLFESFCIALVFAVIFFSAAHYFDRTVQRGKTAPHQRIITMAYIGALILLSCLIAAIRAQFFNAAGGAVDTHQSHYMPLVFVAFSLGVFFVGVMMRRHSMPTQQQVKELREYEALVKERDEHEAKTNAVEQAISQAKEKNRELQLVNSTILEFGKKMEEYIILKAQNGLQQWIRINCMSRPDKGRPRSFDNVVYPFEFKRFFSNPNSQ